MYAFEFGLSCWFVRGRPRGFGGLLREKINYLSIPAIVCVNSSFLLWKAIHWVGPVLRGEIYGHHERCVISDMLRRPSSMRSESHGRAMTIGRHIECGLDCCALV